MKNTTSEIYLSKKGIQDIKKQIKRLERGLADANSNLRELDKAKAREDQFERSEQLASIEALETELKDKRFTLSRVKALPKRRHALKVMLGSVVELIDSQGRQFRYMLVDPLEADPSSGRISIKSPLGQNLVGKQIKDIVQWTAGLGTSQVRLVNIA